MINWSRNYTLNNKPDYSKLEEQKKKIKVF